jgi:hypothetical protein
VNYRYFAFAATTSLGFLLAYVATPTSSPANLLLFFPGNRRRATPINPNNPVPNRLTEDGSGV